MKTSTIDPCARSVFSAHQTLDLSEEGFQVWKERMGLLAACPNTVMKLSGIGVVFRGSDPARHIRASLELFGPDRCIYGSNFPPDSLTTSFGATIDAVRGAVPKAQHRQVFHENARRVYRI